MDMLEAIIGLELAKIPWNHRHEWVPAYAPRGPINNDSLKGSQQLPFDICKHCHKRSNDKD